VGAAQTSHPSTAVPVSPILSSFTTSRINMPMPHMLTHLVPQVAFVAPVCCTPPSLQAALLLEAGPATTAGTPRVSRSWWPWSRQGPWAEARHPIRSVSMLLVVHTVASINCFVRDQRCPGLGRRLLTLLLTCARVRSVECRAGGAARGSSGGFTAAGSAAARLRMAPVPWLGAGQCPTGRLRSQYVSTGVQCGQQQRQGSLREMCWCHV